MYSLNTTQWRAEDLNFIPYSKTDKENMNTGFLHLLRSLNTDNLVIKKVMVFVTEYIK